ncbi:MAG: hypothetical protein KKD33_08325, partial [Verrucomicrobia bacterium]|nr:hypothetical protein [Verrucomicrobiota bacterium]
LFSCIILHLRVGLSATLSYYSYQQVDGKKDNFIFFWGYRTHVIVSKEGIPLVSVTLPNNAVIRNQYRPYSRTAAYKAL